MARHKEYAWVGTKKCGCRVKARITAYQPGTVMRFMKGLEITREPAHKARLDICRCGAAS